MIELHYILGRVKRFLNSNRQLSSINQLTAQTFIVPWGYRLI